jgi:YVTN family beta-propeller protein
VLAAAPAGAATGYAVTADIPVGPGTLELGVDPSLSRLYVSTADGLDVVDTTTRRVLTQGPVVSAGLLAVDAAAHRVYVAHAGSGTVSVMDGTTNGPAGSFDLSGIVPSALAVDASTHRRYVTDTAANSLVVVDGTTNTLTATVTVGMGRCR